MNGGVRAEDTPNSALDDRVNKVFAQETDLSLGRVDVGIDIVEWRADPGDCDRKPAFGQESVIGLLDRIRKAAGLDPPAVH